MTHYTLLQFTNNDESKKLITLHCQFFLR